MDPLALNHSKQFVSLYIFWRMIIIQLTGKIDYYRSSSRVRPTKITTYECSWSKDWAQTEYFGVIFSLPTLEHSIPRNNVVKKTDHRKCQKTLILLSLLLCNIHIFLVFNLAPKTNKIVAVYVFKFDIMNRLSNYSQILSSLGNLQISLLNKPRRIY